jgi:hypothetical protein
MTDPYRTPDVQPPRPLEPEPLWPWRAVRGEKPAECPKCYTAGRDPYTKKIVQPPLETSKLCTGRRVGLCKWVVCAETREHFHVTCRYCGWRTLMATADAVKP